MHQKGRKRMNAYALDDCLSQKKLNSHTMRNFVCLIQAALKACCNDLTAQTAKINIKLLCALTIQPVQ